MMRYSTECTLYLRNGRHFYIHLPMLYFCFQAWQRIEVAQAASSRRRGTIFGKDASVAWTMELPIAILPLHNTASMRAGGGHRDNPVRICILIIAIAAYNIADQCRGYEADRARVQCLQRRHGLPGCRYVRI